MPWKEANVLCLTSVERIAIDGGVSNLGDVLIKPIQEYTEKFAFLINKGNYQIGQCLLGDSIVLVGSILLAGQKLNIS